MGPVEVAILKRVIRSRADELGLPMSDKRLRQISVSVQHEIDQHIRRDD